MQSTCIALSITVSYQTCNYYEIRMHVHAITVVKYLYFLSQNDINLSVVSPRWLSPYKELFLKVLLILYQLIANFDIMFVGKPVYRY